MADEPHTDEGRLARVETELGTLIETVDKMARKFESSSAEFWSAITALKDSIALRDKPNYSVLLSAVSVGLAFILAVGGAAFTPLHVRMNYMEAQGLNSDAVLNHRIDQVVGHFDDDMKDLDTLFQREMRDLDARIVDRVDSNSRWIEKMIDREIAKGDKARGIE